MNSFWWLILFFIDDFFRLESAISKKYTNTNGKDSKDTNAINISINWSYGCGVGNAGRFIAWIVSSAGRFIAWIGSIPATSFLFKIFSFIFFIKFSLLLRPVSACFGSWSFVTFCDVLSILFILKVQRKKIETNMDPIFEHPVFDSARKKMKRFIRQIESHRKPLKTLCTLVSDVGAIMFFLLQNRSGLPKRERLYSTSVVTTLSESFWFT